MGRESAIDIIINEKFLSGLHKKQQQNQALCILNDVFTQMKGDGEECINKTLI